MEVAERIRSDVENAEIYCPDGSILRTTLSIGVISQTPVKNSQIDTFVRGAVQALYAAKDAGRNRVVHAPGME